MENEVKEPAASIIMFHLGNTLLWKGLQIKSMSITKARYSHVRSIVLMNSDICR